MRFAACTTDHCAVRNLMVDPFRRAEEDAALDISDPLYGYMASPTDRLQIAIGSLWTAAIATSISRCKVTAA